MERNDVLPYTTGILGLRPEWLSARLEWFKDLKFGIILHWGPYSQWDCCESWPISPGDPWARNDRMKCWTNRDKDLVRFQRDYWDLNRTFNPVKFNPDLWADAVARAGARYLAFTTKHHDGFCMWDTQTTDYRVTAPSCPFSTHPRRDVFGEVARALQARGLGVSAYFSKADWHCPYYWAPGRPVVDRGANTADDPETWARFVAYTHDQIRELTTRYGKIDVLWLDAGWVRDREDIQMDRMIAMAREAQPGLIVANRTVGDAYEDFVTPEHQIPLEPLPTPWESCLCMGNGWKFSPPEYVCRPTREVLGMLVEIVSKGGNFLMGFGPTPEGEFPESVLRGLKEIGAWMDVNGEAIYGTRPIAPYAEEGVRFTQRDGWVYAFLMEGGPAELHALRPAAGEPVSVLGTDGRPHVQPLDAGVRISLPHSAGHLPEPIVLRFKPE